MKVIQRMDHVLAMIESGVILVGFILLVLLIVINILSRNIFHFPSHAFFEAVPHLVLWLAMMGASLGLQQRRHIRLELVLRHCGKTVRKWAAVMVNLFGLAVMAILMAVAVAFVKNEIAMFGAMGRWAFIFPVFFGLAAFRYLVGIMVPAPDNATADIHAMRNLNR